MFKIDVDEKILEQAVKVAINAEILSEKDNVYISDYLDYSASDATELGVVLLERDNNGAPRFHWHPDICIEEHEDTEIAIMTPVIKAAIEYYLKKIGGC